MSLESLWCPACRNDLLVGTASSQRLQCPSCKAFFSKPATLSPARLKEWIMTGISEEDSVFLDSWGFEPVEVADWTLHLVPTYQILGWTRLGLSAVEAEWWCEREVNPDRANKWNVFPEPKEKVAALLAAGFYDPDEVSLWMKAGFTVDECAPWRAQVYDRADGQTGSYDNNGNGHITPSAIASWKAIGFPPPAFKSWSRIFDDPCDAWRYRSAKMTPSDADHCLQNNQTIEQWQRSQPAVPMYIPVPTRATDVREYVRNKVILQIGVRPKTDAKVVAAALFADDDLSRVYATSPFASEYVAAARELIEEAIERPGLRSMLLSSADYRVVQHMMATIRLGALDEDYDGLRVRFNRSAWAGEIEHSLASKTGSNSCAWAKCKAWAGR